MRRTWFIVLALSASLAQAHGESAEDPENPTKGTFDRALALYDAGNYTEAYKVFSSIDDENLSAMNNVALMRRKGQGTPKDPKGAEEMFERAARAGNPVSQAELGDMLLKGEAGAPDLKRAAGWLTAAALAHHPVAEFELGELYESGRAVPKDIEAARALFTDAAARGVPGAQEHLAALPPPPAAPDSPTKPKP